MATFSRRPINTDTDNIDNDPNEGDVEGKTEENKITGSVQDLASTSQSFPTPVMSTKDHFVGLLRDTSCYWVYARFSDQRDSVGQSLYALDIKENMYLRLPNLPMNFYSENTSSVLDYNLYVIGGNRGMYACNFVHMFDPFSHSWSDATMAARREAIVASVDGRIYMFGGCNVQICKQWAEVYEPSTMTWTSIPHSRTLARALDEGLSPLRESVVLGDKIILRGRREAGIAFDVTSNSWIPIPDNLIQGWWECTRAAVVQNLLITCHGDSSDPDIFQLSIRAYDPCEDVWLMLERIDCIFHENAHRSEFMSVNGKLVIYHMWEQNDIRYLIIEINERRQATVRATLLCQSRFPIATIINEGMDINPDRLKRCVYEQSLVKAFKADV